ncbi:MAG TPA: M1 family metallopeptidase [Candidatus Levybacteria bacterium]|nr:M1 family metallopeptidase [Candidatus Levybacteria bacterium]
MAANKKDVRLPVYVSPVRYTIYLEPDLENFIFTGEEKIDLQIDKETTQIRLHAVDIEIVSVQIIQNGIEQTGRTKYKKSNEEVSFTFKKSIKKGSATLKIIFSGILNDKMRGFYRSKYIVEGKTYHMGVTQFESTDARRAFPCFDEPSQKAIFELSLKIPEDRTAISNTLEEEIVEHKGGYKIIRFSESPKMSSYLLAFIVGHFEYIQGETKDKVCVRVFVTPGKKRQAEFALTTAIKCLEFYTNYFHIQYPLKTLDLIAIPDFAAGAMENWGAVTYRETALLVDPESTSTHNKQWVALVIAHELAHQWFGNLVTMEWWTHLWLNEGFASYMEYVAVNSLFPDWNIWTQFVYMDHARALELDSLKNTHAIEVDVHHPMEISEIFDEVSYSKGASVIRMLAEYLGEKNFRVGLHSYLTKHSYANAKTEDLWDSLGKTSGKNVLKIMQNWTKKPGYPLITVERKKDMLQLSQDRFFSSVDSQKTHDTTSWMVPLGILSDAMKKQEHVLLEKKKLTYKCKPMKWLKVNKNETSFIRVKYSSSLLAELISPIEKLDKRLSEQDRFGVIRDAFVLSEAGYASTHDALGLALAFKNDESYIVWSQIASEVSRVKNILFGTEEYGKFQNYIVSLFTPIGRKIGWDKKNAESHETTLLRSIVLGTLGRNGDEDTIKKAKELFRKDVAKIHSDIRGLVYILVAENGGEREFDILLERYKKETFQEEKDRLLRSLCVFRDKHLLEKTLQFAFSEEVKAQDSFKVVAFICANPYGRNLAFKKVQKEWEDIVEKYGGGHLYSRFIKPFANFTTNKKAQEIEEFFKAHESKGLERTIAQVTEQIRSNAEWLRRDGKSIQSFLKNYGKS